MHLPTIKIKIGFVGQVQNKYPNKEFYCGLSLCSLYLDINRHTAKFKVNIAEQ